MKGGGGQIQLTFFPVFPYFSGVRARPLQALEKLFRFGLYLACQIT